MILKDNELLKLNGGAVNINSTFLNAVARVVTTILDLGRTIGSAINRIKNQNYCY